MLGILGILLSGRRRIGNRLIIGLVLGSKAMKGYQKGEPGRGIAVAGFVCSIVGICLGAIVLMNLISTFFMSCIITVDPLFCTQGKIAKKQMHGSL